MLAWHRVRLGLASTFAPKVAVAQAARLFATPPAIPHTVKELAFLATGERFDIAAGGVRLAAWRFGRGSIGRPVTILSHGWGGRGAQLRSFVAPLVEAGHEVVLFDHVAHGASSGETATLVDFIRGVDLAVRHEQRAGRHVAALVGHSFGAAAIASWLNDSGEAIRSVLIGTPTSVERYSAYFARRFGISESVRKAMQQRFERALGRPWRDFELPQGVARVQAPVLVIHDDADREIVFASGLRIARAISGARLLATHGLGHRAILREPSVTRDAADFIADRVAFAPPPQPGQRRAWDAPAPLL